MMWAGLPIAALAAPPSQSGFDMILRHGTVYDGSGIPGYSADVGIRNGRIAAIGDLSSQTATTDIDVAGLAVAPGFINIHDHPVPSALLHSTNMLLQGVTTEIFNPDGGGVPGTNPIDLASQLEQMSAHGLGTNIGGYIGFNAVWEAVIGKTNRLATADEIEKMRDLVTKNLKTGAFGVSAGLDYKPGYFATTDEVIQVAKAAKDWRTNFPNHERLTPESGFSSRAGIGETIAIGEAAGLSPEITHMKGARSRAGKEQRNSGHDERSHSARTLYAILTFIPTWPAKPLWRR
jgi:N-acyl-D-amino-acid deacylase